MHSLAIHALRQYGLRRINLFLLGNAHNTTFRVIASDASQYVLKLHKPANVSMAEVRSEMQWLEALSQQTDLLVPHPLRDRNGALVAVIGQGAHRRWCRLMRWVPGQRRAKGMRTIHFEKLGELLGTMQNHATTFSPPRGFTRPRFGRKRLKSRMAALRDAAGDRLMKPKQLAVFERAFEQADSAMTALGERRSVFGLIHADLGYGNYLFHRGRAGAIDFEASGFGHFLEDLVEPIHFAQHVPHFPRLCADVLRGYRRARALSDEVASYLPAFLAAAAVTTTGYIASESSRRAELPKFADYFAKHLPHTLRSLQTV